MNSDREVDIAREAVRLMGIEARVVEQEYPSMGAEDFGFFCRQIPSCYVRYGVRTETDDYIPLHSPLFDVDERVLEIGAAFLDRVARVAIARLA